MIILSRINEIKAYIKSYHSASKNNLFSLTEQIYLCNYEFNIKTLIHPLCDIN